MEIVYFGLFAVGFPGWMYVVMRCAGLGWYRSKAEAWLMFCQFDEKENRGNGAINTKG
jgi:hypothetical protein